MYTCLSCKKFDLVLIAGTEGHLLKKEDQYYICIRCGEKFKRGDVENVNKK